jgi:hypothetical protein
MKRVMSEVLPTKREEMSEKPQLYFNINKYRFVHRGKPTCTFLKDY